MPVAMVDSTGSSPVLYYIHADQIGTLQKITDDSMNIVWDGGLPPRLLHMQSITPTDPFEQVVGAPK